MRDSGSLTVRRDNRDRGWAVPGQGVGRAERTRDRDPRGQTEAGTERDYAAAEQRLAAEKVRCSGQVEVQAVGCGRRTGGPVPDGVEGEPVEDGAVGVGIGRANVEVGDERPRLGGGHPRGKAERQRRRACGGDDLPPPDQRHEQ